MGKRDKTLLNKGLSKEIGRLSRNREALRDLTQFSDPAYQSSHNQIRVNALLKRLG
jgi:hypothetical protein